MKDKKGFTLVEIIIVIAILIVIAGIFSVNLINSLNKNREEENVNIVAQIKSAADAYVSTNPEEVDKLYNGYGYVDIPIGDLRNAGLLDEDLSDAETGVKISDEEIVRVKLEKGSLVNFIYPVSEEEKNSKAWSLVAEDLFVDYDEKTSTDSWCGNNNNIYSGLYDSKYSNLSNYAEVKSKLYLMDNSEDGKFYSDNYFEDAKFSVTACNVNPQIAGTYQITYQYIDPSLKTEKTVNRTVYVNTSNNDVISFTAVINDNKDIVLGAANAKVTITEKYKDGSTAKLDTRTDTMSSLKYEIEGFTTSTTGTRTATISSTKVNSDGSTPSSQKANYKVTDLLTDVIDDSDDCTPSTNGVGCYYKGEQDGNYVKYYNKLFRIYYKNGNSVKIIYNGNYVNAPYGQVGDCTNNSCCNSGRYVYVSLGDSAGSGIGKTMDSYLDDFYSSLNKGSSLIYLQSQTFNSYYNSSDYSGRLNSRMLSKKVALLQLNEYKEIAKCTSNSSCSAYNNYLVGNTFWLLDYYSSSVGAGTYNRGENAANAYEYIVTSNGRISQGGSYKTRTSQYDYYTSSVITSRYSVKPTIQLNNAKITGGSGTETDPYVIG